MTIVSGTNNQPNFCAENLNNFLCKNYWRVQTIHSGKLFKMAMEHQQAKGGFKSEGRGGFSQLPKMSAEKTILGFKKWKFRLFYMYRFDLFLQIGSKSIIKQLIKTANAKKVSIFIF